MKLGTILFAFVLLMLFGCGGGGGGNGSSNATVTGRVIQVETGAAPNPTASVQMGTNSVFTDASDGSFQLTAPTGSTTITVDTRSPSGVWVFTVPPVTGVTEVGDLWVGPDRVTLTGTVRNSADSSPLANATVTFGGRTGLTDANGVFTLPEVAYSSVNQAAFWGIPGSARATGFFRSDFSAAPNLPVAGVVSVGDIFLVPTSDPNPPGVPFNIWGQVTAPGGPIGAIVRLKENGSDVRVFNVGADGRYFFFVTPGDYVISASKGASTAADVPVTLTQPTEVLRRDITIPP